MLPPPRSNDPPSHNRLPAPPSSPGSHPRVPLRLPQLRPITRRPRVYATMETACGEAALAVRLYRFVRDPDEGITALAKAEFHLRGSPRPLVHGAEAEVDAAAVAESDTDAEAEEEFNIRPYLALVQGGEIFDLALLSFSGGRLVEEAEEKEEEDMLLGEGEAWEEETEVDAAKGKREEEDAAVEQEARIQLRLCPSRQTAIFVLHFARLRVAANEKAEANRIVQIKRAEGDAESKYLADLGIARQRQAIVDGPRDSVLAFSENMPGTSAKDVTDMVLVTQYFDTMKEIGA